MTSIQRKKQKFLEIIRSESGDWLDRIPVITGNRTGEVNAGGGKIWVRFAKGQERAVLNELMPLGKDRHIFIGRLKSQPSIWRVREVRQVYLNDDLGNQYVAFHHEQHEEDGPDRVMLGRKQILYFTAFVDDPLAFTIQVYGGIGGTLLGRVLVDHEVISLSSYIPATGAVYACVEYDDTGAIGVRVGASFESKEVANIEAIAPIEAGKYEIVSVLLFAEMEELLDEYIFPAPLAGFNAADISGDIDALRYREFVYETNVPNKPIVFPPWNIDGALATGTNMAGKWIAPEAGVVHGFLLLVSTPGSSGNTIVDVNKNGTTIFTTSGNRPTFANTDTDPVESAEPDVIDFIKGDVFSIDIDSVATGAADLVLVPIAYGYNDYDFLTDTDGNLVYELQELESV